MRYRRMIVTVIGIWGLVIPAALGAADTAPHSGQGKPPSAQRPPAPDATQQEASEPQKISSDTFVELESAIDALANVSGAKARAGGEREKGLFPAARVGEQPSGWAP